MTTAEGTDRRRPLALFVLVFALSVPFFLAGALVDFEILPGLPVSSFAWVCPAVAAAILVYRESGARGVRGLLRRTVDLDRVPSKLWLLPALLIPPAVAVLSYVLLRATGSPVPAPRFSAVEVVALTAAFFVAAEFEELGWSGYATEPLQARFGSLGAALLLGAVWAVWHGIPLVQAGRDAGWIAWWALGTVAQRVLIVWLFDNTGHSVFVASVFHAMGNVAWQLFPVNGSAFDPRLNGLILAMLASAVTLAGAVGRARRDRRDD